MSSQSPQDANPGNEVTVDFRSASSAQIRSMLSTTSGDSTTIRVIGTNGCDSILNGLRGDANIEIPESLGTYCCGYLDGVNVTVDGDCGDSCGVAMHSGTFIAKKSVGARFGAFAKNGLLACYGSTGPFAGAGLCGADLFIRRHAGDFAGFEMASGTIVLGRDGGKCIGAGMRDGVLFVRGEVESFSDHLVEAKMTDTDRFRLALLLVKAGVKSEPESFRVYRPLSSKR